MHTKIGIKLKYQISFLLFLILLCQNLLHIVKDAMVMTLGNEYSMIPILRIISMIITTSIFPLYYLLINRFSVSKIFTSFFVLSSIMVFILGFVIFPYKINILKIQFASSLYGVYYYWHISVFYLFCDIWPFLAYGLLFWNMINTAFNNRQAKEYYNSFLSWGNLGLIIAGILMIVYNKSTLSKNSLAHIQDLCSALIIIFVLCIGIIFKIAKHLHNMRKEHMQHKRPKLNLGVIESIKYVLENRYIMIMFFISMSYSIIQQLAEPHFVEEKRKFFSNYEDFVYINSIITIFMGIVAIILNQFGKEIFNKLKWLGTSLIAPIAIGVSLFSFLLLKLINETYVINSNLLNSIIFFLAVLQFISIKSIRFSIWDFAFEMLYVPLNSEQQSKGKATISLLSAKYGKGLALIYIHFTTSLFALLPIIVILIGIWIYNTITISKQYNKYIEEENSHL